VIPFAAVTAFADPSAKFGLQFQGHAAGDAERETPPLPEAPASNEIKDTKPLIGEAGAKGASSTGSDGAGDERGQVIALDAFRKK
jgi:hypothetical protein